jgi:glutathione S-transferase
MSTSAAPSKALTLYVNKHCPYSHRIWWALEHCKADYQRYIIDPANRPPWYRTQVISTGKVPVIAYGGPVTPPDKYNDESVKIPESGVLLEFVADIFPESNLMPKDPVRRAKARLFMDTVANRYIPQYLNFLMRDGPLDDVLIGIELLQEQLPIEGRGEWVLGDEISIADLSVAPFFPRMELAFGNDLGAYFEGEGRAAYDILRNDVRYKRYRQYVDAINANEAFQRSFDIEHIKTFFTARLNALRASRKAALGLS